MKSFLLALVFAVFLTSCNQKSEPKNVATIDSLSIPNDSINSEAKLNQDKPTEIQIDNLIWMTQNLSTWVFANGDSIPEIKSASDWEKAGKENRPAWCYYENDSNSLKRAWNEAGADDAKLYSSRGKLYNAYAVADSRNLCPNGWRVPDYYDWENLINNVGGNTYSGENLMITWGNNSSGFNGVFAGFRTADGDFTGFCKGIKWWSSTAGFDETYVISESFEGQAKYREKNGYGCSVRCVKNAPPELVPELVEYDGKPSSEYVCNGKVVALDYTNQSDTKHNYIRMKFENKEVILKNIEAESDSLNEVFSDGNYNVKFSTIQYGDCAGEGQQFIFGYATISNKAEKTTLRFKSSTTKCQNPKCREIGNGG